MRALPAGAGPKPLTSIQALRHLLRLGAIPAWCTPAMVVLGVLTSLAETLGVSLVVMFLQAILGGPSQSAGLGWLAAVLNRLPFNPWDGRLLAVIIFALVVVRGALGLFYNLLSAGISQRISEAARNGLHEQFLSVSYDFIRRRDQGGLLEILATESWAVATAHTNYTRIVINACSIVVFISFLLALSWRITLIVLVGGLIVTLAVRRLSVPAEALGAKVKEVNRSLAEQILITLQGMRTIRAFGQESAHHARYLSFSTMASTLSLKLERLQSILTPVMEIANLAILFGIIWMTPFLKADFPTVLTSVALLYRLQPHIRELEGSILELSGLRPQLASVLSMLSRADKAYPAEGHRSVSFHDAIRFEGVSFSYDVLRGTSLRDATFEIPVGRLTAVVGASGAGKTTIVNLILRLFEPDKGKITVDGVPLQDLKRAEWLRKLAVAGQDIELIEGTIEDNIRMARADATAADIAAAVSISGLTDFVASLPEGLETWIGQEGLNLSGGQRQRVGLARAVVRNPDFLILDEAMSALDMGLEKQVRSALRNRFRGQTILLITHRLDNIAAVDHVIGLEEGKIREQGPPAELLACPNSLLCELLDRGNQPESV